MKLRNVSVFCLAVVSIGVVSSCAQHKMSQPAAKSAAVTKPAETNAPAAVATKPVYVPDTTHANQPLQAGALAWNSTMETTNVPADTEQAHFLFSFTNISSGPVSILDVHPSCGCTTAEIPPRPWTIQPGESGEVPVTVNIEGKDGTLFKSLNISSDKGSKDLYMRITIEPPKMPTMTAADRARGVEMAKVDRQAVFKGSCASCHVQRGEGKYGKALYDADCAICHEANPRATMVPDLHTLKVPTNPDFWRMWVAHGKPGTLMPAFSSAEGGPLNDMQIATLAQYLNMANPSKAAPLK